MSAATLDALWRSAPSPEPTTFSAAGVAGLPGPAQRYLGRAIAADTRLATAVRVRMHGEIKLRRWLRFEAEEVIVQGRGMIWEARTRLWGLPVAGWDRLVDGVGEMRWRLLGVLPLMGATGPDVTRSAAGRLAGESVWLPSLLCGADVTWTEAGPDQAIAAVSVAGWTTEVTLGVDGAGRLETLRFPRWGNPDGTGFRTETFGGVIEAERRFGAYILPTRMRLGWRFGTERFHEGEFFRGTVDDATFR